MSPRFRLVASERFLSQAALLPDAVLAQWAARSEYLAANPKHPSLKTHEVIGARGFFGEKVFEAYVTDKYRMTWEYGPKRGEIFLRNIDNHDDCLRRP